MRKGFTLVEMLIAMAILSILTSIAVSNFSSLSNTNFKNEMLQSAYTSKAFLDKLFKKSDKADLEYLDTEGFKNVDENGNLFVDFADTTLRFTTLKNSKILIQSIYCDYEEIDLRYKFIFKNDNLNLKVSYNACTDSQPSFN